MTVDRIDVVAGLGLAGLLVAAWAFEIEPLLLSALVGGFVSSLAARRLYDGRAWEALGWLAWLGAAVALGVGLEGRPAVMVAFLWCLVLGVGLQLGGRYGLLADVWTAPEG